MEMSSKNANFGKWLRGVKKNPATLIMTLILPPSEVICYKPSCNLQEANHLAGWLARLEVPLDCSPHPLVELLGVGHVQMVPPDHPLVHVLGLVAGAHLDLDLQRRTHLGKSQRLWV